MRNRRIAIQHLHLANHLVEGAIAQPCHFFAHFFGDEEEEIDDMLGQTHKALAQDGILRGHANRAGVEMAFAHHDAACRNQRRGGKAELVSSEQRTNDHVATGTDTTVDLHRNARAEMVLDQCLMRFRKTDFPRATGMLDRGKRRGTRAAFKA